MHHYAKKPITEKNPVDDARALRRALRRAFGAFATGVTVTTSIARDGEPVGFTANSFTSVSIEPALILVCIAESAWGYCAFRDAEQFCVNVLAADQEQISSTFASRGADKFASVDWRSGKTGSPIIDGNSAYFDCARHNWIDAGDHGILIGHVIDFKASNKQPLCFHQGRYSFLQSNKSNL